VPATAALSAIEHLAHSDGKTAVADRRLDDDAGSGADRGELTIEAQTERLRADEGQRLLPAQRADCGGAEAQHRAGAADAPILAEPLLDRLQPLGPLIEEGPGGEHT